METQHTEHTSVFEKYHKHTGPMLVLLVVVLALILGGIYLWGNLIGKTTESAFTPRTIPNNEPETTRMVADDRILRTTSPSDTLDALYADIESTELDTLTGDLESVEREMGE